MPRSLALIVLVFSLVASSPVAAIAVPIGSLHCNDAEGAPKLEGQTVTITGVVVGQFSTARNAKLYVEDATGAVNVYGSPRNCAAIGDSVQVTGVVAGYGGLTEVTGTAEKPVEITALGRARRVPAPLVLTLAQVIATEGPDGCEPNESRLVEIDGVKLLSGRGEPLESGATFANDTNYRLVAVDGDAGTWVMLRVTEPDGCDPPASLAGQPIPAGAVRVVGVLSQFAPRGQSRGGYQLLPRGRADVSALTTGAVPAAH